MGKMVQVVCLLFGSAILVQKRSGSSKTIKKACADGGWGATGSGGVAADNVISSTNCAVATNIIVPWVNVADKTTPVTKGECKELVCLSQENTAHTYHDQGPAFCAKYALTSNGGDKAFPSASVKNTGHCDESGGSYKIQIVGTLNGDTLGASGSATLLNWLHTCCICFVSALIIFLWCVT